MTTRRQSLVLVAALAVALAAVVPAASQSVEATVDRTQATVGDQIVLTVAVEGAGDAVPQLPDLSAFRVGGRGRSTNMRVSDGKLTTTYLYTVILQPIEAGTFTIGPATLEVDGRTFESRPFEIIVAEAGQEPDEGDSRSLFITATVSEPNPYLGQMVVYTWRFYRSVAIGNAQLEPYDLAGVVSEDLGEINEYRTVYRGQQYVVNEFKKALFPQEVGKLTLVGPRLVGDVVDRRQRRQRRSLLEDVFGRTATRPIELSTPPVELEVRPLPAPPPGFSGLVGSFDVRAELSKQALQVGDSATLTVTVSGSGNPQMISEPEFPKTPSIKVYGDKPSAQISRAPSGLSGRKTYTKALVPQVAGTIEVPAVSVTYFDPSVGSYRTVRTSPFELEVTPGGREELGLTESVAPTTGKVAVRILADDIQPIYKQLDAMRSQRLTGWRGALWLAALVLPPLLFTGYFVAHRQQQRFALDAGLKRRKRARRAAARALRQLADKPPGERPAAASRCLRTFIGDKLGVEGAALTPDESGELLRSAGVGDELVARVHRVLEELEAAQYSPLAAGAAERQTDRVRSLVGDLDSALGRRFGLPLVRDTDGEG